MVPPFYVDCLLGDPGKKEEEVVGFSQEGLQRATRGWGGDAEEKAVAFPAITLCYNYLKDSIHSMLLLGTFTLALLPSDELVKLLLLDFKSCITKESLHVSCKCVSWSLRAARSLTFWFKDGKKSVLKSIKIARAQTTRVILFDEGLLKRNPQKVSGKQKIVCYFVCGGCNLLRCIRSIARR